MKTLRYYGASYIHSDCRTAITIIAVRIIIGIRKFNGYAKKRRGNLAPGDAERDAAKPGGRE